MPVPGNILHEAATAPVALETFLRTHSVKPGEGLIGTVWQSAQPVCLTDVREVPELARLRETALGTGSVMGTALLYGKQNMGVLALGNRPKGPAFSASDFVVFKSIAEQSAFALYNAIVYSEANEKKRLDHDLEIARVQSGCSVSLGAPAARPRCRRHLRGHGESSQQNSVPDRDNNRHVRPRSRARHRTM